MIFKVNQKRFFNFSSYSITLTYNAIASKFSLSAVSRIPDELFDFPDCEIIDENHGLLLTGTILAPSLVSNKNFQPITLGGYSKSGILEDCTIPSGAYPLQFDNLSLKEITESVLKHYDVSYSHSDSLENEINLPFEKIKSEVTGSVKQFLTGLAKSRGIITSNTSDGGIFYARPTGVELDPVDSVKVGYYGIKEMTLNFSAQGMHSDIYVVRQASENNTDAGEATIRNPYVSSFRHTTKTLSAGNIYDIEKAARLELSKELAKIKLTFSTTQFIPPGKVIMVKNADLRIYNWVPFFVEETKIIGTKSEKRYTLSCVLRDVYTTGEVKKLF